MPKNRIAVISVIKRIFKKSRLVQDFRMVRFLSENDKIANSSHESNFSDRASWTLAQNEIVNKHQIEKKLYQRFPMKSCIRG